MQAIYRITIILQPNMLKTLLHVFASCQLYYCNFLFATVPACDIQRLQLVKIADAYLFGNMLKYDSVQPVVHDVLHWLPVRDDVHFQITLLMYKSLNVLALLYLPDMLISVSTQPALNKIYPLCEKN